MTSELLLTPRSQKPVCVGAGLIALDIVVVDNNSGPPRLWAGGSCGNVMAILSYLGWECFPVARLKKDVAAQRIVDDLSKWGVNTGFLLQMPTGSTPIIVERIKSDRRGQSRHRFEWFCPSCGSRLPSYRPTPSVLLEQVIGHLPEARIFYFDRANRFNLEIGRSLKNSGALIFFEPQRLESSSLFQECLGIADIVKYSRDRLPEGLNSLEPPIEIQTMGPLGLRFRCTRDEHPWRTLDAEPIRNFKDAAGAGDWCSAGIIYYLDFIAANRSMQVTESDLFDACRFGQVLAAFACSFEGARGAMYSVSLRKFRSEVKAMWERSKLHDISSTAPQGSWEILRMVCPGCVGLG